MAIVGFFIAWEATLGELLVALGTLFLAGFTYLLAKQTRREVGLTEQSIALSRESIEAIDRPYVIAVAYPGDRALKVVPEKGVLRLLVWNVGKGPGIVNEVTLSRAGDDSNALEPLNGVLPVAADQSQSRALEFTDPPWRGEGNFNLSIYFRSASGEQYVTETRLDVTTEGWCWPIDYIRRQIATS